VDEKVRFVPFSFKSWHHLHSLFKLYRFLRREKFDVVFTQLFVADAIGRTLAYLSGVPVIVTEIQNIIPTLPKQYIWIDRVLVRITDACISTTAAVSEYAERVVRFPKSKIAEIPTNVVDAERFRRKPERRAVRRSIGVPEGAELVLNVGRLVEQKGQSVLIEAAREVLAERPKAYFVIVGSGKLEAQLREQIEARGLGERIKLVGERRDVPELLMAADVFAFPSRWEGQGLILFEAFFAKIPVIASLVGGIPDVVEDGKTGLLVEPGDPRSLASGIVRLLKDARLREEVSEGAYTRFKDRTLEESGHKLGELFLELATLQKS
jgi:glycosyltransferase involved in cell wall biosynthesis